MTTRARVGRVHADNTFQLEILAPAPCRGCEGTCIWRWAPVSSLRLGSSLALRPDDVVTVYIHRQRLLEAALVLHGLPWVGLLAGALVGVASFGGDLGALIGASSGLAAGSLLAHRAQGRWRISRMLDVAVTE